jgi:hypothetical protein
MRDSEEGEWVKVGSRKEERGGKGGQKSKR